MERVVTIAEWEQYAWLRHGFSTRFGGVSTVYGAGDLNLGLTRDDESALVHENRRLLIESVGGGLLITMRQVHSDQILSVDAPAATATACEGDGAITRIPGLLLGVLTADCVPVLVVDTAQRVVGGFHAGWRGTVASIVQQGVSRMGTEFGSQPQNMIAAVGPAIGVCCYRVGGEVQARFHSAFPYASELFTREGHLDLAEANRRQLMDSGIPTERIAMVAECTACTRIAGGRKYFSHRDEQGFTGRMMSVVGIADSL